MGRKVWGYLPLVEDLPVSKRLPCACEFGDRGFERRQRGQACISPIGLSQGRRLSRPVGGAMPPPPEGTPEYHEWAGRYAHLRPDVQAEVARVRAEPAHQRAAGPPWQAKPPTRATFSCPTHGPVRGPIRGAERHAPRHRSRIEKAADAPRPALPTALHTLEGIRPPFGSPSLRALRAPGCNFRTPLPHALTQKPPRGYNESPYPRV